MEHGNGEDEERRKGLGDAIRVARGVLSQVELAERLHVSSVTIALWETGEHYLTLEDVHALEVALDLRLGTLAWAAGYSTDG